jgi:hypothetical protein
MNDGVAFPFAIALIFAAMGVDTAVTVLPRAEMPQFFEVHSITAERRGDAAVLIVDRSIHRPLHMAFSVRVMAQGRSGWIETCAMSSGVIEYQTDNALPEPVTLDWWTWGQCPDLPPGPARIVTTWTPAIKGFDPLTVTTDVR